MPIQFRGYLAGRPCQCNASRPEGPVCGSARWHAIAGRNWGNASGLAGRHGQTGWFGSGRASGCANSGGNPCGPARHALFKGVCTEASARILKLSEVSSRTLMDYPFPGNVRELASAIERAVTFCEGDTIQPDHLPERIRKRQGGAAGLKIARSGENMSEMKDQKAAMLRGLGIVTAAKAV